MIADGSTATGVLNSGSMVAILAPLFPPAFRGGGPIRTLEAMVNSAPPKFRISVLTGDRDLFAAVRLPVISNSWTRWGASAIYYTSVDRPIKLLQGFVRLRGEGPGVLYINSFFEPKLSILPQLLWRIGFWGKAQRLVAPRGEFGSGAFRRRTKKKKLFIVLYRAIGLHRNLIWHASSGLEANDIRALWGNNARVIIHEDDTSLPELPSEVPAPIRDAHGLRAVFLGRIVGHKGLLILLRALINVTEPLTLDVYGPEEDVEYVDQCKEIVENLPVPIRVRFQGILTPNAVRKTLSSYDVLMMPTAGENFAHVIAEALSVSCPVVSSPYTPWSQSLQQGGGVVVAGLDVADWSEAVMDYALLDPRERHRRRVAAGVAYTEWKQRTHGPHLFEVLENHLCP